MEIVMPRGDIRRVNFSVKDQSGSPVDIVFDEIYITFKKDFLMRDFIFQKRLTDGTVMETEPGEYEFTILPEDTNDLRVTSYVFDIELISGAEIKQTFVGKLTLTNEVTFAANEG